MLKGFILGVFTTIALALLAAYIIVTNGVIPAGADAGPFPLETWAATTSLEATLAREAPKGPNPIALTDENLIAGIKLFGQHCAFCHGTAKGDASATPVAKDEYPYPPQLATEGVENDPEGYDFWKIRNGIRWTGMPSWKDTLTDSQIWALALFLKHMNKLPPAAEAEWQKVQN